MVFESYQQLTKPPLLREVKLMLAFWIVTLPVGLVFMLVSGMAFDAGDHWDVDVFVGAAYTYPISIVLAFLFRRKRPMLVFLPWVNIALWLVSGSFSRH